ncbi:hypothetical protein HDV05_007285 [Chytridiales sp. JEL 0842]|nr:hypothetical protein HDV05_007285 [Chytridiales sp. JEL 0842]
MNDGDEDVCASSERTEDRHEHEQQDPLRMRGEEAVILPASYIDRDLSTYEERQRKQAAVDVLTNTSYILMHSVAEDQSTAQTRLKMLRNLVKMPQPLQNAKRSHLPVVELPQVYHFAESQTSPKRSSSPTKTTPLSALN